MRIINMFSLRAEGCLILCNSASNNIFDSLIQFPTMAGAIGHLGKNTWYKLGFIGIQNR